MRESLDIRLIEPNSAAYQETVALRFRILRKPLGLAFTPEQLAAEAADYHVAAYREGNLVACLVLTPLDGDSIKMRQVAVDDGHQGQGIGTELVARAEAFARRLGFTRLTLSARDTAVSFYERLGYDLVGEPFEEVTIPHRKMEKRL